MAKINHTVFDRTLAKIDQELVRIKESEQMRWYVGMSAIGKECQRDLWYNYHLASKKTFNPRGVCAIEDGFDQEEKMIKRINMMDFLELHTIDPKTEKQISFSFLDGHFAGHADGMIKGVIEAPDKWHVWEHKSVNEGKFNKLIKLRIDKGEKKSLKEWDYVYWEQAQCYMHSAKLDRHYLTVSTPGGRDHISVRTERSESSIDGILEKAHQIIKGDIPDKISKNKEFYLCKFCDHADVCHNDKAPLKNCGTCTGRLVEEKGTFGCFMTESLKLKNMEPCNDYDIMNCFSVGQVIQSGFSGKKVDNIKIKGWD